MRRQSENFWQTHAHDAVTLMLGAQKMRIASGLVVVVDLLHCSSRKLPCTIAASDGPERHVQSPEGEEQLRSM